MVFKHDKEVNGIENSLDKLIIDVSDNADNITIILNEIDDEFYEAIKNIDCEAINKLKEVYEEISKNYKLVNSNILSYSLDYAKVKKAYAERENNIVSQLNKISSEHKQENLYEERG